MRLGHAVVAVTLAAVVLAAVLAAGFQTNARQLVAAATDVPPAGRTQVRPSSAGSGDVVVAVVLGQTGTVASDVLAPYEVFASSGGFSVYTVAGHAAAVPLTGGTSLVPTFTFDDVDAGRAARPDVVVVPAVSDPAGAREQGMREFILARAAEGARVMGICSGAEVLAATGLLDGHRATSHWSGLRSLRSAHPAVEWVGGRRWVEDRGVTTTAGVSSGIPAALELVRRLAGPDEAARTGRALRYPGWELGGSTRIPEQHVTVADITLALNAASPWMRPTVAIGLQDGVGEIDVAAALEAYSLSAAARTVAVAAGPTITTRHGVVLTAVPTTQAPAGIARVVVPGAAGTDAVSPALRDWSSDAEIRLETVSTADGGLGFDGALEHIARHTGAMTARSIAKMVDYPADRLHLDGRVDTRAPALAAATLVVAVGAGLLPGALRRARRGGRPGAAGEP